MATRPTMPATGRVAGCARTEKGPDVPRHPAPGIPVHALTDPCSNAGPRRATALATSGCRISHARIVPTSAQPAQRPAGGRIATA
jgi:hypothetical protein